TAEPAARHDRAQLVLTAAQELLEVRRGRTRGLRTRAPRPLGTRAPRPAALIIPGHDMFSWGAGRLAAARSTTRAAVIWEPPPPFNAPRVAARSNVRVRVNAILRANIGHAREARLVPRDGRAVTPRNLAPERGVDRREDRLAVRPRMHMGDLE